MSGDHEDGNDTNVCTVPPIASSMGTVRLLEQIKKVNVFTYFWTFKFLEA